MFIDVKNSMLLGISNTLKSISNTRMELLIVYLVFLTAIMGVIWYYFLISLNKNHLKTKMMLTLIPIRVIIMVRSIYKYLKRNYSKIKNL